MVRSSNASTGRRRPGGERRGGRRWPTSPSTSACPGRWSRSSSAASTARRRRPAGGCSKPAAELGYRPDSLAQGLRRSRTRNLGVLFSLRRPFEVELVEHMYPVVEKLGYHLLLGAFTPGRGQDAVVDELLSYRCEGLIVVGPDLHGRDLEPLARGGGRRRGRPGGHRGPGRRGPQRRRRRHPAGGRAPGRPGAPRDRLHRRRRQSRRGTPERGLPRGDGRPRPGRRDPGGTRWLHRGRGRRAPPGRCWRTGCRRP